MQSEHAIDSQQTVREKATQLATRFLSSAMPSKNCKRKGIDLSKYPKIEFAPTKITSKELTFPDEVDADHHTVGTLFVRTTNTGPKNYTRGHIEEAKAKGIDLDYQDRLVDVWRFVPRREAPMRCRDALDIAIAPLHQQARDCLLAGVEAGTFLICRVILAQIAVDAGAAVSVNLSDYIAHLVSVGVIPEACKNWAEQLRGLRLGSDHEFSGTCFKTASELLNFTEMVLTYRKPKASS